MTDVGNAVLAQQKDVMDAVQRMRAKAQGTGNLKTGSEQKVETKDRKSTRLNSSHTVIYTLSLHDALPIFLAQQKDVMDAVQRMRAKAQGTGNLKTGSEQKVET